MASQNIDQLVQEQSVDVPTVGTETVSIEETTPSLPQRPVPSIAEVQAAAAEKWATRAEIEAHVIAHPNHRGETAKVAQPHDRRREVPRTRPVSREAMKVAERRMEKTTMGIPADPDFGGLLQFDGNSAVQSGASIKYVRGADGELYLSSTAPQGWSWLWIVLVTILAILAITAIAAALTAAVRGGRGDVNVNVTNPAPAPAPQSPSPTASGCPVPGWLVRAPVVPEDIPQPTAVVDSTPTPTAQPTPVNVVINNYGGDQTGNGGKGKGTSSTQQPITPSPTGGKTQPANPPTPQPAPQGAGGKTQPTNPPTPQPAPTRRR